MLDLLREEFVMHLRGLVTTVQCSDHNFISLRRIAIIRPVLRTQNICDDHFTLSVCVKYCLENLCLESVLSAAWIACKTYPKRENTLAIYDVIFTFTTWFRSFQWCLSSSARVDFLDFWSIAIRWVWNHNLPRSHWECVYICMSF